MKIVHLALCAPVTDGWNYQENLLSKYHSRMGLETYIITSDWIWGADGKPARTENMDYVNDDGVHIVRLKEKKNQPENRFRRFPGLTDTLERIAPDILFVHGCQFPDAVKVAEYLKKHRSVRAFADNHGDFGNSGRSFLSAKVLHGMLWRYMAHRLLPYTEKFYGVLPARVDFLKDVYGLPEEKCKLLLMGADDDCIARALERKAQSTLRRQYGIGEEDFLIVTGGKINRSRPETLNLMEAVDRLADPRVKLLIFGNVAPEYQEKFDMLSQNPSIVFVGWQDSGKTYDFMAAADLVVFPGLHSVMWEQAVALGAPCIFRKLPGFDHVDVGGNAVFMESVSGEAFEKELRELTVPGSPAYAALLENAKSDRTKRFLYSRIAEESVAR